MDKRDPIPQDLQERAHDAQPNGHRQVSQVSLSLNGGVTPVTPLRFSEMEPPGPREHVVEGLMPKGHTTSLFGDGGAAKSVLALSAGTAISGGAERWLGRKV
jgi:RecA-family ATPase